MGVFSRLFSRQGASSDAEAHTAPESEVGTESNAATPEIELTPEVFAADTIDATGQSDMSKPATAPGESAVWRSDRISSIADSDSTSVQPPSEVADGSQGSSVSGVRAAHRSDVHETADAVDAPLPTSAPRVRLSSDLVPRGWSNEATDLDDSQGTDAVAGSGHSAAAIDEALAHWLDVEPPTANLQVATGDHTDDRAWLDTFSSIAKLHIQPLRELMYHLSTGCTPRAWVQQTRPVLAPLFDAANQSDAIELLDALSQLDTALELAEAEPTALVGPVSRGAIQQAYARLGVHLPDAFGPPRSTDGRRLLLFEALLLQVPNVPRRVLTKPYAAGIASTPQLLQGSADELSRATGIERQLAGAIIEHVTRFSRERGGLEQARLRGRIIEQVRTLVARLGQLQTEFERADTADDQVRKKAVRRARDAAVLELQRLVAELGEVDLVEELKRCSVRAKVARMQSYLQDCESST